MVKPLCIDCRLIPRGYLQRLLHFKVSIVDNKAFSLISPEGCLLITANEVHLASLVFHWSNENTHLRLFLLRYGHYVEGTGSVLQTAVDVQVSMRNSCLKACFVCLLLCYSEYHSKNAFEETKFLSAVLRVSKQQFIWIKIYLCLSSWRMNWYFIICSVT